MTKEEYQLIIELINKDIENKNIDDLKRISAFLNKQILENNNSDVDIAANLEILMQPLLDFTLQNTTSEERKNSRCERFIEFVSIYRKTTFYDACVFDIIGIDELMIRKPWHLGEKTLEFYERLLNIYGLSLKQKLSIEQRRCLNNKRKKLAKQM